MGNSASATGVIGEMGWQDIEYQVRRRRVMWKARVHHLKEDRWCKRMMEELREEGWSSLWEQIEKDQRELGVIEEDIKSTMWKARINGRYKQYVEEKWYEKGAESVVLKHMEQPRMGGSGKSTRHSKLFRMAKLGDTVSVTGARAPTECKKCGEESGKCIMSHIILRCLVTRKIARQKGVGEGKGVTAEGRMRQI